VQEVRGPKDRCDTGRIPPPSSPFPDILWKLCLSGLSRFPHVFHFQSASAVQNVAAKGCLGWLYRRVILFHVIPLSSREPIQSVAISIVTKSIVVHTVGFNL
jgi:hypothetical protein